MRKALVVFAVLICCLTGCATSYHSLKDNEAGQMKLVVGSESELLSAAHESISNIFPTASINSFSGYEIGFRWFHQPLLDRTDFKFAFKEQEGLTSDGLKVSGYSYTIVTHGTQGLVEARYVQPLIEEFEKSLEERGLQKVYIDKVTYTGGANTNKATGRKKHTGTGFVVSKVGHIITNYHVVAGAKKITVSLMSGETFEAKMIHNDAVNDVALLKVEASTKPLRIISTGNVSKGDDVFTLGYPLIGIQGQEQKATFGRINALSGAKNDIRFLQIDIPIQPGNSGGPLLDKNGSVVGVITATLHQLNTLRATGVLPQNVNYAVKSDYIMPLVDLGLKERMASRSDIDNIPLNKVVKEVESSVVLVIVQ